MNNTEIFRKASLILGIAAFAVCSIGLDILGGIGLIMVDYKSCGAALIISAAVFGGAMGLIFPRRTVTDIISLLLNLCATLLYIYPIGVLNAIPHAQVPKEAVEVLTGRIYPSVAVTVLFACAAAADLFTYEKISARAERRRKKAEEKDRRLSEEEKII